MKLNIEEAKVVHIAPGEYQGVLESITPIEAKEDITDDSNSRECLKWDFVITDKKLKGTMVNGLSSALVNPITKAYKWLKALLRQEPEVGQTMDTDKLKGKKAMLIIKDARLNNDVLISRVVDVLPVK